MKIRLVLFLILSIPGNILCAQSTLTQTNVTLNLNNVSLETFFSGIEKQTGFVILHKEDIPLNSKVSVNVSNEPVEKVLKQVLLPIGLEYHLNGKQLIISKSKAKEKQVEKQQGTSKTVKGKVVDSDGQSLPGASVVVKGEKTGTITDIDGYYSIQAEDNSTLVFSYLGLESSDVPVKNKSTIDVTMYEDNQLMDEVVVVGFGSQKKVNLTGSIDVVDSKTFENRPTGNAILSLQGVAPGLEVINTGSGGQLDATPQIRIRGTKWEIGAGSTEPLILIDGMEGSLANINPQDIENISILKDAAASAIYGSRAPHGVILVTTKSGKSGKSTVSYSNNFRWNTPIFMPTMANSWEYVNYFNDANVNNGGAYMYDLEHVQKIKDYIDGKIDPNITIDQIDIATDKWMTSKAFANVDWLKKYYKDWSSSQEHNLALSGGQENISYYVSANYQGQDGFMRYGTDNRQRYSLTGKISVKPNKYVKLDYSSRFSRIDYEKPSRMTNTFFEEVLRRSVPFHPEKDPNGYYLTGNTFVEHLLDGGKSRTQNEDLYQQLKVIITPVNNWNIMAEMNARIRNNWEHSEVFDIYGHHASEPEKTYKSSLSEQNPLSNSIYEATARYTTLTPTLYSDYYFSLGKHNFKPMVGVQSESHKVRTLNARGYSIISQDAPAIEQTTDIRDALKGIYESRAVLGFFGRFNYDYDNRYLFEVNGRIDGSSLYRRDKRWTTSPSASLGWNVAQEDFFKSLQTYIPYLKLRVSYGTLPNQNNPSFYPTYPSIPTGTANGQWLIDGAQPNTAKAPNLISTTLTWEKVRVANLGVDWGMFNNRLSGSFDIYRKDGIDLMGVGVELPAILGTNPPDINNTDLRTQGFELSISWKDRIKDFSYGVTFNIADNQTRVLKYPNPTGSLDKPIEGELLGNIYGYKTIGIAQTHEEMEAHLNRLKDRREELGFDRSTGGQVGAGTWTAGDIMYEDTNNDGLISRGGNTIYDKGDLTIIGNTTPRFQTSLHLNAEWRGIDVLMFWQGVLKRDYYPVARTNPDDTQSVNMVFWGMTPGGQHWSTAFKEHLDYWRDDTSLLGENKNAYYARPLINTKNKLEQTRYLQDASYIRLKNIQVGYTIPAKWARKAGVQSFRVFVTGENLLTITKMNKVFDPESAGYGAKGGVTYPLAKTYAFGCNLIF